MLTALPGRSTLCAEPATLLRDAPHRTWICRLMGPFGGARVLYSCARDRRDLVRWMTGIRDRRSGCARAAACGWLRDLLRSDCSPGVQGYSTAPDRFRPERPRPGGQGGRTKAADPADARNSSNKRMRRGGWRARGFVPGCDESVACNRPLFLPATVENLSELNSTYRHISGRGSRWLPTAEVARRRVGGR